MTRIAFSDDYDEWQCNFNEELWVGMLLCSVLFFDVCLKMQAKLWLLASSWLIIIIDGDIVTVEFIYKTLMITRFDGVEFYIIRWNRIQFTFSPNKQSKQPFITILFSFLHMSVPAEVGAKGMCPSEWLSLFLSPPLVCLPASLDMWARKCANIFFSRSPFAWRERL